MKEKKTKPNERKEETMTVEKAMTLTSEEFEELSKEYDGFNNEAYFNHSIEEDEDAFYDFLNNGCKRLKGIRLFQKD